MPHGGLGMAEANEAYIGNSYLHLLASVATLQHVSCNMLQTKKMTIARPRNMNALRHLKCHSLVSLSVIVRWQDKSLPHVSYHPRIASNPPYDILLKEEDVFYHMLMHHSFPQDVLKASHKYCPDIAHILNICSQDIPVIFPKYPKDIPMIFIFIFVNFSSIKFPKSILNPLLQGLDGARITL